jgi:hypothetical protein
MVHKKKKTESIGVCKHCEEEYEGHPPKVGLFRFRGKLMCGGCINQWIKEEEEESAYGHG